jgi:chromosome segregation ATPase
LETERFQQLVLETLANLTQEITELKTGQEHLSAQISKLDSRMDSLDSRMDSLESRMDSLESRMGSLESRMDRLESKVDKLEARVEKIEIRLDAIERKQEIVMEQTAGLLEFQSEANLKFDRLIDDVNYLKYKEAQNEADLFKLKSHLQIIK